MIIDVTRTVVERVEIPDEYIIAYAKKEIAYAKEDENFDFIGYISGCGDGSFEGYCEKLLDEIEHDEVWVRFDSREEVYEDIDGFETYMDIKDKDAAIAELVKLIKEEE